MEGRRNHSHGCPFIHVEDEQRAKGLCRLLVGIQIDPSGNKGPRKQEEEEEEEGRV